jgi:hypothetical protein
MEAAQIDIAAPRTRGLGVVLGSLAGVTALADLCLFRNYPRLSVGLFALGVGGLILLNRPRFRWTWSSICLVALLTAAAVQSAIDTGISNGLVLLALLPVLAGETFYAPLRSGWSRWSEMLWSMVKTLGRWIWLLSEMGNQARGAEPVKPASFRNLARAVAIVVPGLLVTLFFTMLLSNGNALFGNFVDTWTADLRDWVVAFVSYGRVCFWMFIAWVALPLLVPSPAPDHERIWTRELPRLPQLTSLSTARLQSAITLGLLNALFCCANTIDVIYLWARRTLPAGVSYSAFVHNGVASLITAVIFSAILLAGMFHQRKEVAAWIPLRLLGLLWIVQNLVLLAGVFLRVKLYVDACDLSVVRVNLVFFLMLVTTGFVLLAIHVWWRRSLGWLLHANMVATFFLFYSIQFLDTYRFVAEYNVNLWQSAQGSRDLDLAYLRSLGPPAFDAIERVAHSGNSQVAVLAANYLSSARAEARLQLSDTPWQDWQLRDAHFQRKLLAGPPP